MNFSSAQVFACGVAFITNVALNFGASGPDAREFLKRLLEDNAVTFPTEKTCRNWTAAFYLNSAEWRVTVVGSRLGFVDGSGGDCGDYDSVRQRIKIFEGEDGQRDGKSDEPVVLARWKTAHAAATWLASKL